MPGRKVPVGDPIVAGDSLTDLLRRIPLLQDLSQADLDQLVEGVTRVRAAPGELVIQEGAEADGLYVVLSGEVEVVGEAEGEEVLLAVEGPGSFVGEMALLEDTTRSASVRACMPSEFLVIAPERFRGLMDASPAASRTMLRTVLTRLRSTEQALMEREKLAALGTLTAGLAHEINNPAAALPRTAQHLSELIGEWGRKSAVIEHLGLDGEAEQRVRELDAGMPDAAERLVDPLTSVASERELESWLAEHGFPEPWNVAPTLAGVGWTSAGLDELSETFTPEALRTVVDWLAAGLTIHGLGAELRQSAKAISDVVSAVRVYAHQQRVAATESVDIAESIGNALTLLRYRMRDGIELLKDIAPDLPRVEGNVAELGQVWTILIENGIDAMSGSGTLEVRATGHPDEVTVEISDAGPGIPADVQGRIFEPFFTTKPPGKGTGLGLAIARRIVVTDHSGSIRCQSRPGRTTFSVTLPVEGRSL